jgi:hypothetical protein
MRLHPRLFNRFLTIAAAVSMVAIVGFGFRHSGQQERGFRAKLGDGRAWADSLSSGSDGRPMTVLFWASWSAPSVALLHDLSRDTTHVLIAAYVRDDSSSVARIFDAGVHPHVRVVNGTRVFQSLKTPGVPTRIRFASDGRLEAVDIGTP